MDDKEAFLEATESQQVACMCLHKLVMTLHLEEMVVNGISIARYNTLSHSLGLAPLKMYGELQCNMGPY